MSTLREYFETDFSHCVRVRVKLEYQGGTQVARLYYDFSGFMAFLAIYIEQDSLDLEYFKNLLSSLEYGKTQMHLAGDITLPAAKSFPGSLQIKNENPFEILAQFWGEPDWVSSNSIQASRRLYLYSETDFSESEVLELKETAKEYGHDLQFRSKRYMDRRFEIEQPLAFICHDSRDKAEVARKLAVGLQKMLCPVWYDEFSLKIGENLRTSIEKGLKECKKCILVLSPNFISNNGWTKKEFDSIFTREIIEEKELVLPVWYGISKQEVYEYCPSLVNVKAAVWDELGETEVCRQLNIAVTQ